MFVPSTLEDYEKVLDNKRKEYKRLLKRYKKVVREKCNCDRLTCGRCSELQSIKAGMYNMGAFGKEVNEPDRKKK